MDLKQVLLNVASADPNVRNPAEATLAQAAENQYAPFIVALCQELANEASAEQSRQIAGLFIKNMLTAQDEAILQQKITRWNGCDAANKAQVRALCLQALRSPVNAVSHTTAQVLASIGALDVPEGNWPDLLPALFQHVAGPEVPTMCKVHSLEALGYMCDAMDPDKVEKKIVDQLLNTIVDGMRTDRPNEMKLAGITAMCNSLDFTHNNFDVQAERDAIMSAICASCQCQDVRVREKAFECLVKVAEQYYDKLPQYLTNLFQMTVQAIRSDEQEVGKQAIEFWCTICDTETDFVIDIEEGNELSGTYYKVIEQAAPTLVPVILEALTKQEEDEDEDDDNWDIAAAGAACLEVITNVIRDGVMPLVIPFVTSSITSPQWRVKGAALMAFAMILDGPSSEKMLPVVQGALPVLIGCLQDQNIKVKETATFVIARICSYHIGAITPTIFPQMIQALSLGLDDQSASVCARACYAIHNLAEGCEDDSDKDTNLLSNIMPTMLQKLLNVVNRPDWEKSNLRQSAYEAVNVMVTNSANDMNAIVVQVLNEALTRLQAAVSPNNGLDANQRSTLPSQLCSLVGVSVNKLSATDVAPQADRMMGLILQVFNIKASTAHEDAFIAIGSLATKLEKEFGDRYAPHLVPPMINGMCNVEETAVCSTALGLASDLCRAMGPGISKYSDDIMRCTLNILRSQTVNRSVKPIAIGLFSDVANAIEGEFEKYAAPVLAMLGQAGLVSIEAGCDDEDHIDYINSLRESILEAYSGIVQGLNAAKKEHIVVNSIQTIVTLIHKATADSECSEEVLKASIALLGDLGSAFGNRMHDIFSQGYITHLLQQGRQYKGMQNYVTWTADIVTNIRNGKPAIGNA